MSGVRIPPPRPTPLAYATGGGVSLRVSAAESLLALLDGGCSSPGRAPDCGSGGSGFETRQPPHYSLVMTITYGGCWAVDRNLTVIYMDFPVFRRLPWDQFISMQLAFIAGSMGTVCISISAMCINAGYAGLVLYPH